jgi:lipopolysaccharide transport system ATP-binding protein
MILSEERIIQVENLAKSYHIWSSPLARLQGPLCARLARWRLLPDGVRERLRRKAAKCCREFFALREVSFSIKRGESLGVIGRNGSGKSTLLQMITGTLRPTAGTIQVRGRVAALLELGAGFNPEFTGRENVELNAALHGLTPEQIRDQMESILAFADIGDFVDEPVKTYSSGMLLRLAFAVIVHVDADILIVDEALAVGDVFFVQKCMTFLRKFQETGVLLLVSHSADAITALCQQALWLDAGRLRQNGKPKEVTEAYMAAFFEDSAKAKRGATAAADPSPVRFDNIAEAETLSRPAAAPKPAARHDQRLLYLNHTQFRNDLEVFEFDPQAASFGVGGGRILHVALEDESSRELAWIVGGEVVTLKVQFVSLESLRHPIVGFYVKNLLGQHLFGDNTFFSSRDSELATEPGGRFEARFVFQMPILPPGDYMVAVALADGTQVEHIMHHWMHDALAFKSTASPLRASGLLGLPMCEVKIQRLDQPASISALAEAQA